MELRVLGAKGRGLVVIALVFSFVVFWGVLLLSLPSLLLLSEALACGRDACPCTNDATEALCRFLKTNRGKKQKDKKETRSSAGRVTRNESGEQEKGRTPCSSPSTRVPREFPSTLECTAAPHACVCSGSNSVDVQVKGECANAA
jgi:hypothetical protein